MRKRNTIIKLIVFAVIAAALILTGAFSTVRDTLFKNVPMIFTVGNILSILILVFTVLFIQYLITFILEFIKPKRHRARTVVSLFSSAMRYISVIVILCGVLAILNVDVVTIVAGLGVIALIIGFAAESLISDIVTGIFILIENQYNVGDIIEVNGFRGTVTEIGIRTTSIMDVGGNVKIINNADMKNILNRSDKESRATAEFSIPYGTDLETLEKQIPGLMEEIYSKHADMMKNSPRYLGVQELADSAVILRFVVEVKETDIYNGSRVLNRELLIGFRKLGVECPFPQVDIHTR